jgi:hypothetical protein
MSSETLSANKALFWENWKIKRSTPTAFDALWRSQSAFLSDWDTPFADLVPKEENRVVEHVRVDWIARFKLTVAEAGDVLGLPAEPRAGELVAGLEAILDGARGKIPPNAYARLYRLHEWLAPPAVELLAIEQRPGMSDQEWDDYVRRIADGE